MRIATADTHALIWLHTDDRRLGRAAAAIFAEADRREALIFVPTIALVEISESLHHGRIRLDRGFDAWVDGVLSNPAYQLVELSLPVVRRSQELYAIPERSDRLLAATAIELECPLITRDARITASGLVPTLW